MESWISAKGWPYVQHHRRRWKWGQVLRWQATLQRTLADSLVLVVPRRAQTDALGPEVAATECERGMGRRCRRQADDGGIGIKVDGTAGPDDVAQPDQRIANCQIE